MQSTYQLIIKVEKDIDVKVGRLGRFHFPTGFYIYTGSAKRGMKSRLARHFSNEKKLRWHIDYLLIHSDVQLLKSRVFSEPECELNQNTQGEVLIGGFGSSDCRSNCGSHLKFIGPSLFG